MIGFEVGIAGEIEIYTDKRGLLAKFDNIFLDQGLNALGTMTMPGYVWVGSGNTAPLPTNTTLANLVAKSSSPSPRIPNDYGVNGTAPYYTYSRQGFRFNAGDAAGNLSEVGLGSSSILFTRALIKDANGVPTTLTILPDEILDISYTVRIYAPVQDVVGSITLGGNLGGTYSYVMRASAVTTHGYGNTYNWAAMRSANYAGSAIVYTGPIGTITQSPSGSSDAVTVPNLGYINNSYKGRVVVSPSTTQGNLAGGIKSIKYTLGWGSYQIEFTPAIPKTNLDVLNLTFEVAYGRYTP